MQLLVLVAGAVFAACVAAHGGVNLYTIGWKQYSGYTPSDSLNSRSLIQRKWTSNFPVTDMTSSSITCNTPGTPAPRSAVAYAGSQITVSIDAWPHDTGAVVFWMSPCNGPCKNYDPTGRTWFKIQQTGLMRGSITDGWWALRQLQSQNGEWNVTIPSTLKGGEYLLRSELIALHVPYTPEFYPECAQLKVMGNGTRVPAEEEMVAIPGIYKADDPCLVLDIWADGTWNATSWPIPGPAVWTG